MTTAPLLIGSAEAAMLAGVNQDTIRRWTRQGTIPAEAVKRIGTRTVKYHRARFLDWLNRPR
jgi:excisionase family DNA binding protein